MMHPEKMLHEFQAKKKKREKRRQKSRDRDTEVEKTVGAVFLLQSVGRNDPWFFPNKRTTALVRKTKKVTEAAPWLFGQSCLRLVMASVLHLGISAKKSSTRSLNATPCHSDSF